VWHYISDEVVTQYVGGLMAENMLEANTVFHNIGTPPNGYAHMGEHYPTPHGEAIAYGGGGLRSEAPAWTGASSSNGQQHLYVNNSECFHIQTQLPDGRKSLLIDPGSVGNLCGDKWAK
jgi:hypothetical protein